MSRYLVQLRSGKDRETLHRMIDAAPYGTRVELKAEKRSLPQNDRMWAMISEVALQLSWHGRKMPTNDWKLVFLDALKREVRIVPNIDGTGFVNLGKSSSDLTKAEMGDLMTIIEAFAAEHGVQLNEEIAA